MFSPNFRTWVLLFLLVSSTFVHSSMSEIDAKKRYMREKVRNMWVYVVTHLLDSLLNLLKWPWPLDFWGRFWEIWVSRMLILVLCFCGFLEIGDDFITGDPALLFSEFDWSLMRSQICNYLLFQWHVLFMIDGVSWCPFGSWENVVEENMP